VDSIAITYALLDPIMTVVRPVVAFVTAAVAGIAENVFAYQGKNRAISPDLSCPVDGCCDGNNCAPQDHSRHHTFFEKLKAGFAYAFGDLWQDMAVWFLAGLLLAGFITVLIPDDIFNRYLGSGLPAMLLMLAVGIPLYICATASTPIAAALILKGVSPGVALVFLLAGPATNLTSLTVIAGTLGKRATAIYLSAIALCSVIFGLLVDQLYAAWGLSARAMVGEAPEVIPLWMQSAGALIILLLSIKPVARVLLARFGRSGRADSEPPEPAKAPAEPLAMVSDCSPT